MAEVVEGRTGSARPDRRDGLIALVGNPNVGKSTLFNQVTGRDVATAHYAGKTLDVHSASLALGDATVTLLDLPGTYGVNGASEEQVVNRTALLEDRPDCVVVVLDSANLQRNLATALQVLELGRPSVVVLNLADEAAIHGLEFDAEALSSALGVPVFETVAVNGVGVASLVEFVTGVAVGEIELPPPSVRYDDAVESVLRPLTDTAATLPERPYGLSALGVAVQLIEGHAMLEQALGDRGAGVARVGREARAALEARTGDPASTALSRARHGAAGLLAERCTRSVSKGIPFRRRLTSWATTPALGIPMLIGVLLGIFGLLFVIGDILARLVSAAWGAVGSPVVQYVVHALAGEGVLADTLLWGFDAGLEASLAIGLPYILTFYLLLSLLEDSGYLNSVAFLSDRLMHRVGLHGRATIPLVAGLGCSVPAVLSIRLLPTKRERFIAGTLISMVPCSARTAVVMGAVGVYVGFLPALGVFVVTAIVAGLVGVVLDRLLPGESRGMVMEMFPFRRPSLRVVGKKAWLQFREFLYVATPLVVVGSIVLGGLYESGWLFEITGPLDPVVVGWLGLPSVAGITLLFGLLRKEFALQLLVTLAIATMGLGARELTTFMSQSQIFVFALVNTLAMPCISTLAVLGKVVGVRRAATVMFVTVGTALLVGGIFARVLPWLGGLLA